MNLSEYRQKYLDDPYFVSVSEWEPVGQDPQSVEEMSKRPNIRLRQMRVVSFNHESSSEHLVKVRVLYLGNKNDQGEEGEGIIETVQPFNDCKIESLSGEIRRKYAPAFALLKTKLGAKAFEHLTVNLSEGYANFKYLEETEAETDERCAEGDWKYVTIYIDTIYNPETQSIEPTGNLGICKVENIIDTHKSKLTYKV